MEYGIIIDRVAQYLDRSDLGTSGSSPASSTHIGNWVNDTRKDLGLKHNFDYLYVEATISTSAGSAVYSLPTDYLGHLVILSNSKKLTRLGAKEFEELIRTDEDERTSVAELVVNGNADSGAPEYYIDRGMYIELYPNPDDTYIITLKYYAQPADFDTTDDEDYMSRFHFEAVIFGAALRGAIFLDDQAKIQIFMQAYDRAIIELLKRESEKNQRDKYIRVRSWKDYDLTAFKRLHKISN